MKEPAQVSRVALTGRARVETIRGYMCNTLDLEWRVGLRRSKCRVEKARVAMGVEVSCSEPHPTSSTPEDKENSQLELAKAGRRTAPNSPEQPHALDFRAFAWRPWRASTSSQHSGAQARMCHCCNTGALLRGFAKDFLSRNWMGSAYYQPQLQQFIGGSRSLCLLTIPASFGSRR